MMDEDDGAPSGRSSPSTPKKAKMESEEPKQSLKAEDHSEDEESKEIEDDYEDEDEDGSPPLWQQSSPLLDMIDLPPSSPLPPTPPLPSSPTDLNMEEQDSEDEGPPPGWDNTYQLKEEVEHMLTPPAISTISSDISDMKTEDVQNPSPVPDIKVEERDSEDEGPPPGWDSKCQPEPELQTENPIITQLDIKTEDMQQDVHNGQPPPDMKVEEQDSEDEGPPPGWDSKCQPQPQPELQTTTQSDIKMEDMQQDVHNGQHPTPRPDMKVEEQDSEDEGPPPGWDSKCQPQPELKTENPTTTQSDIKTEDMQQDPTTPPDMKVEEQDSEDEGPPPGWDSKYQPEPELHTANPTTTQLDLKTEDIQQEARNGDDPQPPHPSEMEEHGSEDEGPPPGWDSKCQPEPELQTPNPTTIRSDSKIEDEGPPPGWGSTSSLPSGERMECEEKKVEAVVERLQPPSRQQSVPPIKPQKPPVAVNNPEMGQMVCGSCRRLLSYPKGARYVECGCCLEENYVLEEHEVGQVICGGCNVLLMYPYGAPKVRCVNCTTETEIGDQNRRPPLSEHQRRGRRHLKRLQTGKC